MAKVTKVNKVDVSASVEMVTDSNVGTKLEVLDVGYTALVSEVLKEGKVEGTILYIPGINYKTLCNK